ncbi:MAG: response regulator transcription factor [Lachnospiraceae bacterium]|nr:response regulator transcription factor [Lachnospiraceae bacterium]
MSKILIVEDDTKISRYLELELKHEGYEVMTAFDGKSGLEKAVSNDCDMILLDVMLPLMNGMDVCSEIRKKSEVPIIMLTALGEVADKVRGLELGVDDYMTKPFSTDELLARIKMVFNRRKSGKSDKSDTGSLSYKGLEMNLATRNVYYNGEEIQLTKKEFELLEFLLQNKNVVHTRDELMKKVWKYDYVGETNIVDVYIRYIRQKVELKYNIQIIETVRGVGYLVREE